MFYRVFSDGCEILCKNKSKGNLDSSLYSFVVVCPDCLPLLGGKASFFPESWCYREVLQCFHCLSRPGISWDQGPVSEYLPFLPCLPQTCLIGISILRR